MQNTTSIKIDNQKAQRLKNALLDTGYTQENPGSEYILWRLKSDLNVVLYYKSTSLVIQGKGNSQGILDLIGGESEADFKPHLGSDEVGKGDYFGPLVVCCAYLDENGLKLITNLGIADSKSLSDKKMLNIYDKIKNSVDFEVSIQFPKIYNQRVKEFKNLSFYLATLHKECAESLNLKLQKKEIFAKSIVIDQFSLNKSRLGNEFNNMGLELSQFHKGESDIVVALASVIARVTFLLEMKKMGEEYSFDFPRGASNVIESAKLFVEKFGAEKLNDVAKVSFRTTSKVLSPF